MEKQIHGSPRIQSRFISRFWKRLVSEPLICLLVGVSVFITLFYAEENWRGKRAWQKCKRELEGKGAVLDWPALLPPAVPDAKNMFKAPKMEQWFVGKGQIGLPALLRPQSIFQFATQSSTNALFEIASGPTNTGAWPAKLTLCYAPPILTRASGGEKSTSHSPHESTLIPVVVLDRASLTNAIRNLARMAKVNLAFDSSVNLAGAAEVSKRWENVSALQALIALLNDYSLKLVDNPKTGIARIKSKNPGDSEVYVEPDVRQELRQILDSEFRLGTNSPTFRSANATQGFTLLARPPAPSQPVHVFVEAESPPTAREVVEFFPVLDKGVAAPATQPRVETLGSNLFKVFASPRHCIAASDYLAWSDQFEPEFEVIREGLKRPYAQLPADYQQPFSTPVPNFLAIRITAQTLAQRAQSFLLLEEPEQALRELTLLHELCRLLQAQSGGRPVTLVAAMIEVAISGLYVATFADGLRLQVWREPQLAAIQAQLENVNLLQSVWESLVQERAAVCWTLQTSTVNRFSNLMGSPGASAWDRIRDPSFLFFTFGPRGWAYRNMVTTALLEENFIAGIDPPRHIVKPHVLDKAQHKLELAFRHFSPDAFLASQFVPNFSRATQRAARNQTLADEALVVCALERHRQVSGEYPETLAELVPEFAARLPNDLINGKPLIYRRTRNDQFLLYSIGWNEMDDGGVPSRETGDFEKSKGDWVWQLSSD